MGHGCQYIDAAQAVAASVAQIELAVREVKPAVEQLGLLIDAMATGLTEMRTGLAEMRTGLMPDRDSASGDAAAGGGVAPSSGLAGTVGALEQSVHGSITHLQFYDRLVQHLSHVQTFLSGVAAHLANGTEEDGEQVFESLRAKLRVRLISEAQRELLDAMLPPPGGAPLNQQQARDEHAAQGTIELF